MNLKKFSLFVLFSLVIAFVTEASTVEKSVNARYGFSQFDNYKNGYFKVWNNLKWGVCDADGNEITAPAYDAIWDFNNGFAVVNMGAKWVKTATPKGVSDTEKERNFEIGRAHV